MSTPASSQAAPREKSYFDLHISGLGYLNRIREVKPKKGEPFLACDIAALNGSSDQPERLRFDCRVSGREAQHLVRRCAQAVEAGRKVLIGFKLGDLWTDIFTHAKGKHTGEQAVSLKVRLLFIRWIKVDGKLEYQAEARNEEEGPMDVPTVVGETPAIASSAAAVIDEAPAEASALAEAF